MKRILWVLAVVVIFAFVLSGARGLRETADHAGIIFGRKVTFAEYRDSFNAAKNEAIMMYGPRYNELRGQLDLENKAWERIIMLDEAKRKKVAVSNKEVIARIASYGYFMDTNGAFDKGAYERILVNAFRTEPRQFEEEMRQRLMIEKLLQGVFEGIEDPAQGMAEDDEEAAKKIEEMRFNVYREWYEGLYEKAGLVNNIQPPGTEEAEQEESRETPEEGPEPEQQAEAEEVTAE